MSEISSLDGGKNASLLSSKKEDFAQKVHEALEFEPLSNAIEKRVRDVVETSLPAVVEPKEPKLNYVEKLEQGIRPGYGQSFAAKTYETIDWTSALAVVGGAATLIFAGIPLIGGGILAYGIVGRIVANAARKSGHAGDFWSFLQDG